MNFNLPKKEKEILKFWRENKIFEKSLERTKKGPAFIFYEGPPYANGKPGIHHALARAFKDIILRYKTMEGFYVKRKAGWDTHGLPTEIAAEKTLGIKSKKEIEKIGVEKFIQICKENVFTYKKEWEKFTEMIGYWLDMKNPYITCSSEYIESLFYIIKKFYERGFFYKDYKVVPWCPRCQTTLASHELAQGYQKVKENSIYVKFKVKSQKEPLRGVDLRQSKVKNYLLVWTTTPWTLPGNVAIAFNPKIKYVIAKIKKPTPKLLSRAQVKENQNRIFDSKTLKFSYFILAKSRLDSVFGKGNYEVIKELKASDVLGLKYEPLFPQKIESKYKGKVWRSYSADFVSSEEGTGFVHIAPAFGEDDFDLGKKNNLPSLITVDEEGNMKKSVIGQGKFVKEADREIIKNLKKRELVLKEEIYEHDYPFCWRCDTPILYYLHSSWFVATRKVKKELLKNNKKIEWHPKFLKYGRFGNFLEEVRDWNFSRERYWGTPLPVWECKRCKNTKVIGSKEEMVSQKFSNNRYFLLRHGLSQNNIKKILNSNPKKNYKLTKKGREQVKKAAEKLKKILGKEKIDLIFSSDIYRCKETAEIIKKELNFKGKIYFSSRLRELDLGEWEGKKIDDFQKVFLVDIQKYLFEGPKGGESWNAFKKRMLCFLESIDKKYSKKNILIIGHGDPLWALYGAFLGWDSKETIEAIKKKIGHFQKGELRQVEYKKLPYNKEGELDFHRPYIDNVVFECEKCKGKMVRTKEVCDVWFDSGAMPFAQAHWPIAQNKELNFRSEFRLREIKNKKLKPPELFPADFICEAMDQTRGWFYTLIVVSTLLGFPSPYKRVLSVGLVMDKFGRKMSKSRGNIISPWKMVEKYGADTLRWYFYTINQPWKSKNFNEFDLRKCLNRFILTLYNSFVFYRTYASSGKTLNFKYQNLNPHNVLDKWILSCLQNLILRTKKSLKKYDVVLAAREIENFVIDSLSNWYIRRSRPRFQKPKDKKDLKEAEKTLGLVLLELSKILAPFIPFLAEEIYRFFNKEKNTSVHLENFPVSNKKLINNKIENQMKDIRELIALALAKRKESNIKVRQPLASLKIKDKTFVPSSGRGKSKIKNKELLNLIQDEINVKEIVFDSKIKEKIELDTKITPALKEEGFLREIIRTIQDMRKKGGFKKENLIEINYEAEFKIAKFLEKNKKNICKETLAKSFFRKKQPPYSIERKFTLDNKKLWLGIKKIAIRK